MVKPESLHNSAGQYDGAGRDDGAGQDDGAGWDDCVRLIRRCSDSDGNQLKQREKL